MGIWLCFLKQNLSAPYQHIHFDCKKTILIQYFELGICISNNALCMHTILHNLNQMTVLLFKNMSFKPFSVIHLKLYDMLPDYDTAITTKIVTGYCKPVTFLTLGPKNHPENKAVFHLYYFYVICILLRKKIFCRKVN